MADLSSAAFSEVDSENNTATLPSWAEGMNPSDVNNSARALQGSLKRFFDRINATVTSSGSANAQTLTYFVPPEALTTGQRYAFIAGFTNTGATSLDVGVGGALAIFLDGGDLIGGEIQLGNIIEVVYDGTRWQLLNTKSNVSLSRLPPGADPTIYTAAPRLILRADTIYYVNPSTGSDTDGWGGNSGGEWATIQYAYDWLLENVDAAGYIVTIYQSGGTDSGGLVATVPIVGALYTAITLNGNIATTNPWGIAAFHSGTKLEITGGGSITALTENIVASEGAFVGYSGPVQLHAGTAHFYAQNAAAILIRGSYDTQSGSTYHWLADSTGSITVYPSAGVQMTGTPGFSGAFAFANTGGQINVALASFGGTATGTRYIATTGGGIFTGNAGGDFLPGDADGSADDATMAWYY